ncbi:uncharacterized protein LOC133519347 isoform X1 [Cydia pomonella]|uniref:uncharacterized protein LOC133519347 isoform X1 n=1 Tax=Cydia pomonella TaxID=82600 RepID=UPI002ADE71E5|nr:uncharacterized protein LOC133519347 isoform X1 [Cydia pomonella]
MMFEERKVNIEGVPLNSASAGAANIFLNSGKNTKAKSDGTVIHLNTEKPAEVGVHINTTLSIASSKKIKLLFILNFLLSVLCMVISSSIAFYYWNEMISMRRQLETMRDQFVYQSVRDGHQNNFQQSALTSVRSYKPEREPRMDSNVDESKPRRYYVEDLGEDMLLVDSSKKADKKDKTDVPVLGLPIFQKELLVAQFNGAMSETHLGSKSIIGPWERDVNVSSKDSESKIELHPDKDYVTIKESGLYLVYAQIVYLSRAPNCYFVWARQSSRPRLLSTCATGDNASNRNPREAQMSCAVQTLARFAAGDTVNLAQREPHQILWLRPGNSYFGFVKLSS